ARSPAPASSSFRSTPSGVTNWRRSERSPGGPSRLNRAMALPRQVVIDQPSDEDGHAERIALPVDLDGLPADPFEQPRDEQHQDHDGHRGAAHAAGGDGGFESAPATGEADGEADAEARRTGKGDG